MGKRLMLRAPTKVLRADGKPAAWSAHTHVSDLDRAKEEARAAHARLREALEMLPQGIVFLDAEGRYILWNEQYAKIYQRSADLFKVGARLADTLRIGVMRGDYPAAKGREEEWLAERLAKLHRPANRHEQWLADGRCILIEERRTSEGGIIGLRVDITELKEREASFRLLFEGNPVPMFIFDRADEGHPVRQPGGAAALRLLGRARSARRASFTSTTSAITASLMICMGARTKLSPAARGII